METKMNKYAGMELNWDDIYRVSSEIMSILVNKASDKVELFFIASAMAAMAKANIENNIVKEDWSDTERSAFWNDIEAELKKHEAFISETMTDRKSMTIRNIGDSIKEQLEGKYEELHVIAQQCDLREKDVRYDIADSMDKANKLTKPMDSLDDSYRWWGDWWYKFLMEWNCRCFTKYVDKCKGIYLNYEKMRNYWLSDFEPLWIVGSDIARFTRMDLMTKSMTKIISDKAESYNKSKQESIWKWVNGFDKTALEIFEIFKQKQRTLFDGSFEWLKDYDKNTISDKIRRFMSN
jgi:hypothetical protein